MKTTYWQDLNRTMPIHMRNLYWLTMGFGAYGPKYWFGVALAAWAVGVCYNFHPVVDTEAETE
jgi:hypothetical protein